ncbi:Putative acyl-CoA dehydrogenase AidB [Candidatus Rubidus massiliensis]|nr:Putative acyl-CoA dehydrogenase AidB [Candidatus Rubidus massiliensis]
MQNNANPLITRKYLQDWQNSLKDNPYLNDQDFTHSISLYFPDHRELQESLKIFGENIVNEAEPLVIENNLPNNLPRLESYDGIGNKKEQIIHHPTYEKSGNIIYSSGLLSKMKQAGRLLEALTFLFLSGQLGEAGHNCPMACSAGIIRVLQKVSDFPEREKLIEKLVEPSFSTNYTGAQFLTEVQGGSDVGANAVEARFVDGVWKIYGEKWFCSNANAELFLITARYNKEKNGTKGLGLFLIQSKRKNGSANHFHIRRLKDKIGTRSMASAEIDFLGAEALPVGALEEGFSLVMENVLHISRLFNTFCVLGMARRAYTIAKSYANYRFAFGNPIINYPLVQENLAIIKAENNALLASIFATTHLQDVCDMEQTKDPNKKLLLRLLANLNKYFSAFWSVQHIHHALDVLAGNGAIETFSIIPRLLRDCIVCENWEGTHNVLRMQILRDIHKYQVDQIFITHLNQIVSTELQSHSKVSIIQQQLLKLQKHLDSFKKEDPILQSLKIKSLVDEMASLYAATHLLIESKTSLSKEYCFDLFTQHHLKPQPILINKEYVELLKNILSF